MKNNNLLTILAFALAMVACSADNSETGAAATEPTSVARDVKPDVSLTNTYWKLVELNGSPVEPGEGKALHMILKGQGQVAGYAGCNQIMGSFTETGSGLSLGPIASTRRMCEGVMDQEMAFLQALENTGRYEIKGEEMAVRDAQDTVTMRFVAVYFE